MNQTSIFNGVWSEFMKPFIEPLLSTFTACESQCALWNWEGEKVLQCQRDCQQGIAPTPISTQTVDPTKAGFTGFGLSNEFWWIAGGVTGIIVLSRYV